MTILVREPRAEIERLQEELDTANANHENAVAHMQRVCAERDRLKVDVEALLCDCPDYADVERLCHVLSYLGYSTPTGGEASARWLSLVKELISAVETSELLRRDKAAVAEYRQLKAENAELLRGRSALEAIATMPADQIRDTYNLAYYAPREIGSDAEQIRAGMTAVLRKAMTKEQQP